MIKYLQDTYLSKTTCRLLRVKLEKDLKSNSKTIKYFKTINFTTDNREILYCLLNNFTKNSECNNPQCKQDVKFLDFSRGYRKFCSIKCSKNSDHIKNIDVFGKQASRRTPITGKTSYQKKVRELTRQTYNMNSNLLNPNDYPFGKMGVEGAYQLDHIISVNYGYENGIEPEIISGINNLRVIPWRVNAVKNKFNSRDEDWDFIVKSYEKKDFLENISIDEFISKYCLNKSGKINTKINHQWFKNRNIGNKLNEILELTSYLNPQEKIPYRIFHIFFNLHKYDFKIENRTKFMRSIWSPTKDYIDIIGDDKEDFKTSFMCYDKSINKYRIKSNSYSMKETANKQGTLYLYYKYY
jgi:hypothetical protein